MSLAVIPLTDRGERRDATALHATLGRIHEIRYDLALTFVGAVVAVWLVRIGRPEAASVADGWLRAHVTKPPRPSLQPALEQLDQLLDSQQLPQPHDHGAPP